MGCDVYANGDEIACKAGDNKVIAAMPDVCLSPPSPPAGPIPVPYPNTSFSKDMQHGSKTVMIKGKEVMLKDQSFYKTSPLGDEAATNGLGAGVVSHVITGKTYCAAWSMDVQFEGQNVDRHTDLTTSNHASPVGTRMVVHPTNASAAPRKVYLAICDCCKGPAHSAEQAAGESMTAEEWYQPSAARKAKVKPRKEEQFAMDYAIELLKEAKAKKCDVVHSDPSDPCARHYVVKDKQDKENIDHDYEASIRPVPPYKFYHDIFTFKLWKKVTKRMAALHRKMQEKRTGIAHKTPRGAGGCPFGTGNVKVVEPGDCHWIEKQLGEVQGKVVEYYRR